MKLAAIAKLIKADEYCKLYKVLYEESTGCDLYIGTKTTIFPLSGFPKAQNESELATLLGISKSEWEDIQFDADPCPNGVRSVGGHESGRHGRRRSRLRDRQNQHPVLRERFNPDD